MATLRVVARPAWLMLRHRSTHFFEAEENRRFLLRGYGINDIKQLPRRFGITATH